MAMFRKALKSAQANILVGLLLVVPIFTTVVIFHFLLKWSTEWFPKGLFPAWVSEFGRGYPLRILIILLMIAALCLVGVIARSLAGKRLYHLGDQVIAHIPLVKSIYKSVRQISESLFTQRKTLFKDVVLVEYPRKGLFAIAFVTTFVPPSVRKSIAEREGDPHKAEDSDSISLFIPTTPNPTSGVLILARRSECIKLNLPVSDALTFVMSAGAVSPGSDGDGRPTTMLDRLESWLRPGEDTKLEANNA
jgi:uncharacterized membrane protein